MSSPTGSLTAFDYEQAALRYLFSLPPEHFMEATSQATQREITLESMALLKTRHAEFQYFSELLVQYLFDGQLRQVVPDNMVTLSPISSEAVGSYNVELEAVPPFLVLEYVSPTNPRKDYVDSFRKYEQELKVPYYLTFRPDTQDLRLYRHNGEEYVRLERDTNGRYLIEELDLEVGLLDGWVRYWHRGQLLEVPAELQQRLERLTLQLATQARQLASQSNQIASQSNQIEQLHTQVQSQAESLKAREVQIEHQAEQLKQVIEMVRGQVEERARKTGRQDILERLPTTTDLGLLSQWLKALA